MKALVLAKAGEIAIEDVQLAEALGPDDVQIKIHSVGICGSDVHYYQHGRIGPFVVNAPMVLGHEASGVVLATGKNVTHLSVGDRVCMEPGIPDLNSAQTRAGIYNLDPAVRFWATPPVHGCLRETVIHPAAFTFKLPDNVSFAEGAMVEPLAIGMQAATKAGIKPGDIALVIGAGPIGVVTSLAALAGGCSDVIICDQFDEKLAVAASYEGLHAVNIKTGDLAGKVATLTSGNGADVVFECSGAKPAIATLAEHAAPAGYRRRAGQRNHLQDHFPLRQHVPAHAAAVEQRQVARPAVDKPNLQVLRQRGRLRARGGGTCLGHQNHAGDGVIL